MKSHTGSGTGFRDAAIRKVFENHEEPVRGRLLELGELIIDEAGRHPEIAANPDMRATELSARKITDWNNRA